MHLGDAGAPVAAGEAPEAAEPPPVIVSVAGLILLTAVILFLAGLRIRRMEIDYGGG